MRKAVQLKFGPSDGPGRSAFAGGSKVVNCFVEPSQGATQSGGVPYLVYSNPGFKTFCNFADQGKFRGFHYFGPSASYAVSGETLYKIRSNGTASPVGIILGSGPILTAQNKKNTGAQFVIVTESVTYVVENDIVTVYPDADLPLGVTSCAYLDGYIIFGFRDGRFFITDQNEATSVNPLDFAEAEASPDDLVCLFVNGRELVILGGLTGEVWVDTGNADFPFERVPNALFQVGCLSKFTPKAADNTFVWISNKGHVVRAEGYIAKRISDFDVEADIQRTINKSRGSSITADTWIEGGHEFYAISSDDWTHVYDFSTQLWARGTSLNLPRWRRSGYVRAFDRHLVGDISGGACYEVSDKYATENGTPLVWTVRAAVVEFGANRIAFNALSLVVEPGIGDMADSDSTGKFLMLKWSDDRAKTFDGEALEYLGAPGDYKKHVLFEQLGMSEGFGRIFEISSSATVRGTVVSGVAQINVLGP